ncbi:hypothetical protein [Pseudoalteromonas sp. SK18]|uniref:hypothetical protein n=1 Tax=Pseudoalteromonas sp. SK18 TaxID=1938366 RepID=UPI0009753A6B|nr:hypothetical protein [Pseudoalteromonas sp. SK18]
MERGNNFDILCTLENGEDYYYRGLLSNSLNNHQQCTGIETMYRQSLPINKKTQSAIELIAKVIYPLEKVKREKYYDAAITIILHIDGCSKNYISKNTKNRSIQRVESTLKKGGRVFSKALILTQCYSHYIAYLEDTVSPKETWNDFLIKYRAFYGSYDNNFTYGANSKVEYQYLYESIINAGTDKCKSGDSFTGLAQDWAKVRPVLHLVLGIMSQFEKSVPHIYKLIKEPTWLEPSLKRSQYFLAEIIDSEKVKISDNRRKLNLSSDEMLFIDIESNPIFLRKSNIFS